MVDKFKELFTFLFGVENLKSFFPIKAPFLSSKATSWVRFPISIPRKYTLSEYIA
ncbi:MAG: hypothetical protein LBS28_02305 [Streptococcaceae bacterium]|nr:hypothetical protein [Streptococcaceae bacterium]